MEQFNRNEIEILFEENFSASMRGREKPQYFPFMIDLLINNKIYFRGSKGMGYIISTKEMLKVILEI